MYRIKGMTKLVIPVGTLLTVDRLWEAHKAATDIKRCGAGGTPTKKTTYNGSRWHVRKQKK